MSDPFRDHNARKRQEEKEQVGEDYIPVVLWLKVPEGKRIQDARQYLRKEAKSLPYVSVATGRTIPYRFATSGVSRLKNLESNESDE